MSPVPESVRSRDRTYPCAVRVKPDGSVVVSMRSGYFASIRFAGGSGDSRIAPFVDAVRVAVRVLRDLPTLYDLNVLIRSVAGVDTDDLSIGSGGGHE